MNLDDLKILFENAFDSEIAENLINSFSEIESNYIINKWKPSELDAGHFVETVRRIVELKLFNKYTPFNQKLPHFNDQELRRYEQQPGHESYRMLLPRILKAIYNIRNKRGVGHISDISPNEMDATLILYNAKWVLAELVRLNTNFSADATQKIIDKLIERNVELIWSDGDIKRVLEPKIKAEKKVLILLYDDSPLSDDQLRNFIEYRNEYNFKKILKKLHSNRYIEYSSEGECKLTPKGMTEAELIIQEAT